ncbi:MAG: DEAD/DEAH box helicase [Sphingobacteriales bacterium]|nr:DEAD/DEAH box helicase [Sphingobacteriales bacterium]
MSINFEQFSLNRQLLSAIEDLGYTEPTPIQLKAIPTIMNGQDLLGVAQTGTGKTAAYSIPIIMNLKFAQGMNPRVLVLSPTRELAIQIHADIVAMSKYTDLRSVVLYGGLGPKTQKEILSQGLDIVIATPGRLVELYLAGDLILKDLKTLIIDEADKMLDMGFIHKINKILEIVPRKRQNMLFSATMSEKVKTLAGDFLAFPIMVEIAPQATPADLITQYLYKVPNIRTKINLLQNFLENKEEFTKVIVFCKTRQIAENLYHYAERVYGKDDVRVIHANKGQNTRINSIQAFKEEDVRILIGTDVASRGLDVANVSHVINFDVPLIYEDYVHRIGRTGRASQSGVSITFCNPAEEYHLTKIEKLIRQKINELEVPTNLYVKETPFTEAQAMAKEIDMQKRKDNPDFKGAFHEKKFAKTVLTKNISDIAYKKAKDKEKKDKIRNSKSTRGKSGGRKKS